MKATCYEREKLLIIAPAFVTGNESYDLVIEERLGWVGKWSLGGQGIF